MDQNLEQLIHVTQPANDVVLPQNCPQGASKCFLYTLDGGQYYGLCLKAKAIEKPLMMVCNSEALGNAGCPAPENCVYREGKKHRIC